MSNYTEEIMMWNEERDNLRYTSSLEYAMMDEELEEFLEAGVTGDLVGQADALADMIVVATGGLYKLVGGDMKKFNDIMLAVTAANNTKSSTKDASGKITKPESFVGPEAIIATILGGE